MGVAFTAVFPLTFVSNAFVPIDSMPPVLQHVAAWNPVSVLVAAVRDLFGNPSAPTDVHSRPLEHAVVAGFAYCALMPTEAAYAMSPRVQVRTTASTRGTERRSAGVPGPIWLTV
jgi:ABC-type multidrug transport system permease subunit